MSVQLATSIGILLSSASTAAMTFSHAWVYFRTNGKHGNGYADIKPE